MSNKKFFTILTVVCILIVGAIFALTTDVVSDAINHFRGTEKVEQVVTNTKEEVTEYTIQDVLDMREQEREYRYLDSVYMDIPDIPLIAILMRFGTDMSHTDISKEYLLNRKNYDNIEFGAQIRDAYEHTRVYQPDSIPIKAKNDTVLPNQQ